MDDTFEKAIQDVINTMRAYDDNFPASRSPYVVLKVSALTDLLDGMFAERKRLSVERDAQQQRADGWQTVAAEFQTQCEAEKKRVEAVMRDLQKLCEHGADNCTDWACSLCKHSIGLHPIGCAVDCELIRYDDEADEYEGECKWEWRGPESDGIQKVR